MSVLDDLKPRKKLRVMDLLGEAGVDISNWKNYRGKHPAANPKAYNWSFEQPGELVVVCLWHNSLEENKDRITFYRKYKGFYTAPHKKGASVWNPRDAAFGADIEMACRQQLPIRVIVVDGKRRDSRAAQPKKSEVVARLLDPVAWAATAIEDRPGDFVLVRGAKPTSQALESPDIELSAFEGSRRRAFVNHRRREDRLRRAKIAQAKKANGGKLICEVPKCRFDFVEKYGPLGTDYAQVHHLLPLGKAPNNGHETKLADLAIVCANCHAMIHRGGECRPLESLVIR